MQDNLQLLHVVWDGPLTVQEARAFDDDTKDYGVYQIYSTHPCAGPSTLVYIGQANKRVFSTRITEHQDEWCRCEPQNVAVHLGRLGGLDRSTTDEEWGRLIDLAEAVLIYKTSPPYNSSRISSLNCKSRVLVVNHGMRRRLPESVSNITEFVNRDTGLKAFQAETGRAVATPEPHLIHDASRIDAD